MKSRLRLTMPVHELAICEAVLKQALDIAAEQNARHIGRITLHIGPLTGVEPDLVRLAFPLVAAGTACEDAVLEIEPLSVNMRCPIWGALAEFASNRPLCAQCATWCADLISGDEHLLARIELQDEAAVDAGLW